MIGSRRKIEKVVDAGPCDHAVMKIPTRIEMKNSQQAVPPFPILSLFYSHPLLSPFHSMQISLNTKDNLMRALCAKDRFNSLGLFKFTFSADTLIVLLYICVCNSAYFVFGWKFGSGPRSNKKTSLFKAPICSVT